MSPLRRNQVGVVAAMLVALEIVWTRRTCAASAGCDPIHIRIDEARRLGIDYYELGESTN
ncbi:MAG: hypothetical protein F4Y91_15730 [Gemmatimonadetes bacterium]|nr:hypothetical protein [Gemmatimonadota bacterium]MXY83466.1 hypothetical protein [Gemmatimonadota bacterium]MYB69638.1 hypothetical protein [Gemmatimonadota bacterium]